MRSQSTFTIDERERFAYYSNDPQAPLLAELADRAAAEDLFGGVATHIDEARTQFPAEDFLDQVIDDLRAIAKRLRGDNKDELLAAIQSIDDIVTTTRQSSEYGIEELDKARGLVDEVAE